MNTLQNRFAIEGILLILSAAIISASSLHSEESIDVYSKFNTHSLAADQLDQRLREEPHTLQRRNDFFLKVAGKSGKSVPRIGRRNIVYPGNREELDSPFVVNRRNDFFLKAHKSIPRIGRRNSYGPQSAATQSADENQAHSSNQHISKKFDSEGMEKAEASAWPWFRTPGLYVPQKRAVYFTENPAHFGPGVILWDQDEHPAVLLEDSEARFGRLD